MANNFLVFCETDTGTNLLTQGDYAADADRTSGQKPGIASSKLNNKALRQANYITSQVAQQIANNTGADVLDDGNASRLLAQIKSQMDVFRPQVTVFTSTGTYTPTYLFFLASGSATTGATYTNNGFTYTVVTTIASGTVLRARGTGAPLASGTLTKSGGTGDNTITYYATRKPISLNVIVVGGGGGGGGASTTTGSQSACGGGGGGAGASLRALQFSSVGATETVTVGAAGAAGTAGANNGGNGSSSSFGAFAVGAGGTGGNGGAPSSTSGVSGAGGAGAIGTTGDLNLEGGDGCSGGVVNAVAAAFGNGGASPFSGSTRSGTATGNAGKFPGGGGSGGVNFTSASGVAGGAGALGVVQVIENFQ